MNSKKYGRRKKKKGEDEGGERGRSKRREVSGLKLRKFRIQQEENEFGWRNL